VVRREDFDGENGGFEGGVWNEEEREYDFVCFQGDELNLIGGKRGLLFRLLIVKLTLFY